jgi:hypothetical protein
MKHLLSLVFVLFAAACAPAVPLVVVSPSSGAAGELKPATDVMDDEVVVPRDGAGAIVIARPKVWLGKRCTFDIALDDRHVAALRPGEQLTLYADPGERIVDVSVRDEGGCKPATAQVPLDVISHTTSRIQLDSDRYYDLKVEVNSLGGSLPK